MQMNFLKKEWLSPYSANQSNKQIYWRTMPKITYVNIRCETQTLSQRIIRTFLCL